MKRYLSLLIICFTLTQFAYAQVEKGFNLVGGSSNIGLDSDRFLFTLTPNIGWFVVDGLAQGGQISIFLTDDDRYTYLNISLMPFIRYYFGKAKTKPFIHAAIGLGFDTYWRINFEGEKIKRSDNQLNYELKAGIAYFITEQVALEGALAYRDYGISEELLGNFVIDIGFQVHIFRIFNRKKESEMF